MSIHSSSRKPRRQNHKPQNGKRLDAALRFSRSLRLEPLECRRVLAAVSWDGLGDGVNWSDPINWSNNALPTSADDVTISLGGTITHASGGDTIRSLTATQNLTLSGGSITVTTGASTISGALTVSNLATLTASGATAVFTASGAVTLNGASLFAQSGGKLNLTTATSYVEQPSNLTFVRADGTNSKIDLSGITSVTGVTGAVAFEALNGGNLEIDSLASTTARDVNFNADGATSVMNLAALTSVIDTTLQSSLTLAGGATLTAPSLATFSGGSIVVNGMTATLGTLTNIDLSSLFTGTNGILSLPSVTSYVEPAFTLAIWRANGLNSKVDLTSITSITGATGNLFVEALAGGTIELDGLGSTTARDLSFTADGATSVLNLNVLTSATDTSLSSNLTIINGATLIAPVLATYNGGTITVENKTLSIPSLTNLNSSSLVANSNGNLTLPNLTSYAEPPSTLAVWRANGANSKIDLTSVTSVTGTTGNLFVEALAGGTIELDGLGSTTARDLSFTADGATSVLNLNVLTSATDTSLSSNLTIINGATLIAPVLATYNGGSIVVENKTLSIPSLTNFNSSSLFAAANGIVTLPNLTSYAEPPSTLAIWRANGLNSKIDLTSITSITGATGNLFVEALAGGTIELDGLGSTTARDLSFTADGATSVLNLNVLTSATDTSLSSNLTITNGATLIAPVLATYNGGTITVENKTLSIPSLTNLNSSSLVANANGILTLPNLTSYAEPAFSLAVWRANGANSKLDLTSVTSVTGTGGNLFVEAQAGGTVEIDSLAGTTARDFNLNADGVSSLINASALTTWSDSTASGNLTVTNSGTVTLNAAIDTLTGVTVTASSSGTINAGTLILSTNSPLVGNGGTINANVTSNQLTSPGTSPGRITINGVYVQGATANFAVEINGLTAATQYDQLDVNGTVALSGNLVLSGSFVANVGDTFIIIDNDGVDPVTGTFNNSPEGDVYTFNGRPLRLSYQGGDGNDVTLTRVNNLDVNRRLFYNQSVFDGNNVAIGPQDDAAIATDKVPYLPGAGLAVFANVSSYSRGINGIMIDISGDGPHTSIGVSDFIFKVGNNNSPSTWASAPAPSAISVRTGAGYRGADRIEITWPNGTINNTWLEVQVLATAQTNLAATDVFFWGNKVGDSGTGTPAGVFQTTSTDAAQVFGSIGGGKPIKDLRDYNRDGQVTSTDAAIVFANIGSILRLNIGVGGPFAPEAQPMSDVHLAPTSDSRKWSSQSAVALAFADYGRSADDVIPAHTFSGLANSYSECGWPIAITQQPQAGQTRERVYNSYHEESSDLFSEEDLLDSLLEVALADPFPHTK